MIEIKEKETINDFTTRITRLVNQVKTRGETNTWQYIIAKILHFLTQRFDNIVVAIEELKDLMTMRKEELQSFLEAHEQRIEKKNVDKEKMVISLQARFNERDKKTKGKWPMSKGREGTFRILVEEDPKFQEFNIPKG